MRSAVKRNLKKAGRLLTVERAVHMGDAHHQLMQEVSLLLTDLLLALLLHIIGLIFQTTKFQEPPLLLHLHLPYQTDLHKFDNRKWLLHTG